MPHAANIEALKDIVELWLLTQQVANDGSKSILQRFMSTRTRHYQKELTPNYLHRMLFVKEIGDTCVEQLTKLLLKCLPD